MVALPNNPRIALFVTCLVDLMRPEIGFAAITLLEHAGCEVVVPPDQTCCGQPAYNSGDRRSAHRLAERVLEQLEGYDYVVIPSGSCAGMIKVHYADLFSDDPGLKHRLVDLGPRIYELSDFLANVMQVENVPGKLSGAVTYHDSCSGLRELGVCAQPRQLLKLIPGVEVREMKDARACCGFGGTFAVKFESISIGMADQKVTNALATGAEYIISTDLSCLMHVEGYIREKRFPIKTMHIADVLAQGW
ncbi:MAG: (Fe-S)-binding protein [Burkholderiaceae bacterium]